MAVCLVTCCLLAVCNQSIADESTEASIAAYADAANFQTNGAFELAIDGWRAFLRKYPSDDLVPKASHYLGVCYMQKDPPDYPAAAEAFQQALKDKKYELRQETLANQGWCYYASAGEGPKRNANRLRQTIKAYDMLRKEFPKSEFLDRVYFYCGEAQYGLGDRQKAIANYDRLLSLPNAKESPLRCDALYARGIAYEELNKAKEAIASFEQLLGGCSSEDLVIDVHLRIGDMMITQKEYDRAVRSFESAYQATDSNEDRAYSLFRQGYALVQAGSPRGAAAKYDALLKNYPDSPYSGAAMLASAQSTYRDGNMDAAAVRFKRVLQSKDPKVATEAAHWLTRIYIGKDQIGEAIKIAENQIGAGAEGEYAIELKVDLAEALSMQPDTMKRAISVSEDVYRQAPNHPLAPRALYSAAFSALQINEVPKATALAKEFLAKFPRDTLTPDVRFIAAEGNLVSGKVDEAAKQYKELLSENEFRQNPQRPVWVIRGAMSFNAAKKYSDTNALVSRELGVIKEAGQKAELMMLDGQAYMRTKKYSDAAAAFQRSVETDPKWARADECKLLAGQMLYLSGKPQEASAMWEQLIGQASNARMADQARYKLAQMASQNGDHKSAIGRYDKIIRSNQDAGLITYAQYGKGWSLMQLNDHAGAVSPLTVVIQQNQKHPLFDDALLARGISLRNEEKHDEATRDLKQYLELKPTGVNLGHALYEMALIDQKRNDHKSAAARLQQLVDQVPKYPSMDKVMYELGWSQHESGDDASASEQFNQLISRYPNASVAADAAYFVGQQKYKASDWVAAAKQFRIAADKAQEDGLSEKAYYRLGWSHFKAKQFEEAETAFKTQSDKHPEGRLSFDATMMVGECRFKASKFPEALEAYRVARERIQQKNESSKNLRDPAEKQIRELVLLHGGQCAAQTKAWDEALSWYQELRERFPATGYLSQAFYESGFAHQQKNERDKAIKLYSQVADNYRNEVAARARFMMGEIYFGQRTFDKAIPEFQRVMFGFGADRAPVAIKNWQAKSGFEAARCSELMLQQARTDEAKTKARNFALKFYQFVVDKHPDHELAGKARERIKTLSKS